MTTRIAPEHRPGGAPYAPPPGTAISGLTAGDMYRAELAGTRGEATGFAVWTAARVDGAVPVLDVLFTDGDGGNNGWQLACQTGAGGYYFKLGSAFGGGTSFNTALVPPSAIGKVDRIVGVYDGAGTLSIYVNGVGAGAGFVGPAVFDAGVNDTVIGCDASNSWPASRFSIIAAGYTPLVPSAAVVLAWDTAMKANAGNAALPGSTFHWQASDAGNPPGPAWVDSDSAGILARIGAPTAVSFVLDWA